MLAVRRRAACDKHSDHAIRRPEMAHSRTAHGAFPLSTLQGHRIGLNQREILLTVLTAVESVDKSVDPSRL